MVVDTSTLLAIFFNEKHALWAKDQLNVHRASLYMSTINFAEVLILLGDRKPARYEELKQITIKLPIQFVPPTVSQSVIAAESRLKFPSLNLGDCFAYALAKEKDLPIITLDADFKSSDVKLIMP